MFDSFIGSVVNSKLSPPKTLSGDCHQCGLEDDSVSTQSCMECLGLCVINWVIGNNIVLEAKLNLTLG